MKKLTLVVALLFLCCGKAVAATYDFNSISGTFDNTSFSSLFSGVTFENPGQFGFGITQEPAWALCPWNEQPTRSTGFLHRIT